MSDKLGFTFYPKDWWTSESYFELSPLQRYYYLECLFIMYSNDGLMKTQKTQFENRTRTEVKTEDWEIVVSKFIIEKDFYTHESVNKRLRKAVANRENGKKGGRPPKPKEPKKETQNNPPLEREKESESEEEIKGNKTIVIIDNTLFSKECKVSNQWIETIAMQNKIKPEVIKIFIDGFESHLITMEEQKKTVKEFKEHFSYWLKKQDVSTFINKPSDGKPFGKTNQT